jgi:hypothetical protein
MKGRTLWGCCVGALRRPRRQRDAGEQGSKMAGKDRDGLGFPEPTFEQSAPGMVRPVQSCLRTFGGFRGCL